MNNRLYVGNLPYSYGETELRQLFGKAGQVDSVYLPLDRESGRPRGFAFVQMATDEEAAEAIARLDGATLDGRKIRVNVAQGRGSASIAERRAS